MTRMHKTTASWKDRLRFHEDGYFEMGDEDTRGVPVRLFLTHSLLEDLEDSVHALFGEERVHGQSWCGPAHVSDRCSEAVGAD